MIRPPCSTTNWTVRAPRGAVTNTGAEKLPMRTSRTPLRAGRRAGVAVAVGSAGACVAAGVARAAEPSPEPPQPSIRPAATTRGRKDHPQPHHARRACHTGCAAPRRARCSTRAATTPPIAPNRWPCHEMPGVGTRPVSSVEP